MTWSASHWFRDLVAWVLFRIAAKLARFAVWIQRDGAAAIVVAMHGKDAVMGSWHLGHVGYADAVSVLARAEADHLEAHVATLNEIEAMTNPAHKDPP